MNARKIVLTIVVVLSICSTSWAQSRRLMGGSAGGRQYQFFYDTFLEPSAPELGRMGGGTLGGEGTIHRFMSDRNQRVYFGYDVSIDALSEPNTYRITFNQLTLNSDDARQLLADDPTNWMQLRTANWGGPAVRTIRAGEVLALDLLTNMTTGQKIVDYITVQGAAFQPKGNVDPWHGDFIYETGAARDFRADDAALEIRLPRISINDSQGTSALSTGVVVYGSAVWFYVPQRGRFILSLTPHPELGFRQAGEIRGSTLTFSIGDDNLSIVCAGRIAPGSGPFNVYVLHDPMWRPPESAGLLADSLWGAADRLDQLIGR